jgi:hypothetical protein
MYQEIFFLRKGTVAYAEKGRARACQDNMIEASCYQLLAQRGQCRAYCAGGGFEIIEVMRRICLPEGG